MDHLCYFCLFCYFFVRVCLLIPCGHLLGKGWPLSGDCYCIFCIFATFPCGILGQVWYLIVSFPDLCRLSYFVVRMADILLNYAYKQFQLL